MSTEPIKSERDHQRALEEIESLIAAKPNTLRAIDLTLW